MVALDFKLMHSQYSITASLKLADAALTRSTQNLVQVVQQLSPFSLDDAKKLDDLPAGFTPAAIVPIPLIDESPSLVRFRRWDWECLFYSILYVLLDGHLPWIHRLKENINKSKREKKCSVCGSETK